MDKPFKETAVGKIILEKIPDAAAVIGDVLPDHGVIGIVKNIIDKAVVTPEEKAEILKGVNEFELQYLQEASKDRADARAREVQLHNTIGVWVQNFAAIAGILAFLGLLFILTRTKVEIINKDILNILLGSLATIVINIYSYWFGSSAGSARKDQIIDSMKK